MTRAILLALLLTGCVGLDPKDNKTLTTCYSTFGMTVVLTATDQSHTNSRTVVNNKCDTTVITTQPVKGP